MKKTILMSMLCIAGIITARAEDKTAFKVWVESNNFQAYNLNALPVIKHVDGKLVVKAHGNDMGKYDIKDGMKITFSQEMAPGNANEDDDVTMADANVIVNKFLNGEAANINVTAADANKDGIITMADANETVNIFLNQE